MKTCSIDGCAATHHARGWCNSHYQQFYKDPNVIFPKITTHGLPLDQRVKAFYTEGQGCWDWRTNTRNGYGSIKINSKTRLAHIVMYELNVGPIPEGMMVDHRCRRRSCVRPDHLRLVTNKQNHENLSGANRNSTSGVRGVNWDKKAGKWAAGVRHNYKRHNLGYFLTIEEAEAAVIAKRNELFSHNDLDRKTA